MAATLRPRHPPSSLYFSTPLISPLQASEPTTANAIPMARGLHMALGSGGAMIWWRRWSTHGERSKSRWVAAARVGCCVGSHYILWFFGQHTGTWCTRIYGYIHDVRSNIYGTHHTDIRHFNLLYIWQADRACGSSSPRTNINIFVTSIHGQTDSHSLVLFCFVSLYVRSYVRYTYRSARKSDLLDTSNPPQAVSCVSSYETYMLLS
jgi:hypothetical protein